MNADQLEKMRTGKGFIAALDQSGGSTPKALALYGVAENAYSNEAEMFELIHAMRARIITSPAFNGDRILGAILFQKTMESEIEGLPSAHYLWQRKQVIPFLKVDKGLADEQDRVRMMKPMPELDTLLDQAKAAGIFGTKMRSVIMDASDSGIKAVVAQQFELAKQILAKDLMPIIEPEVDINSPHKTEAETLLKQELMAGLEMLGDHQVMFKLTLPNQAGFYTDLVKHPKTLRFVALSGGYSRKDANAKLAENPGVIASFSRALTEGLSAQQSDKDFNKILDQSIESIYQASIK